MCLENVLTALRYLMSGNYIVQLVAQQRPEILQHWQYQEKKGGLLP